MAHILTRDSFTQLITSPNKDRQIRAIGRALVHLFNRQVEDEKKTNNTRYHNGVGFTPADARTGSITAKYYLKHGTLLDWQVEKWTRTNSNGIPRLAKYWRQLDEVAKRRAKITNRQPVNS